MILDKEIEIVSNAKNMAYYIGLGYKINGANQKFVIKVEHLSKGSQFKINAKCDFCGNEKKISFQNYFKNSKELKEDYCCCVKCALEKRKRTNKNLYSNEYYTNYEKTKETNLIKYGFESPSKNEEIKEKIKNEWKIKTSEEKDLINKKRIETCIQKYNFENVSKINDIKEQKIKTSLKNWGFEHPTKNLYIKEKIKNENYKNNGFEYPMQNSEIKEKSKLTKLKIYGCSSFNNREKAKNTCLNLYNNENYNNVDKIKNSWDIKNSEEKDLINKKRAETVNKLYGVDNVFQNKIFYEKHLQTMIEKYGVKHALQSLDFLEKQQKNAFRLKFHKLSGLIYQGKNEEDFLNHSLKNNIKLIKINKIIYNFENKERFYFPDFYYEPKNLIIEVKSIYTYNLHLEKNLAKQKACIEQGYNFMFVIDMNYEEFNKTILK
jgi:hypothetical protein